MSSNPSTQPTTTPSTMSQPAPAIPAIVKHTIIDAITDARRMLVIGATPDALARHTDPASDRGRHILATAKGNLDWLDWVSDLVASDHHDPAMLPRLGAVAVALEDIATGIGRTGPANDVAANLKVACLLLQQARRAATMDAVIRDIRKAAVDISAMAAGHIDDAIAKSIEAQADLIAQKARR